MEFATITLIPLRSAAELWSLSSHLSPCVCSRASTWGSGGERLSQPLVRCPRKVVLGGGALLDAILRRTSGMQGWGVGLVQCFHGGPFQKTVTSGGSGTCLGGVSLDILASGVLRPHGQWKDPEGGSTASAVW